MPDDSKKRGRKRATARRLPKDIALLHGPTEDGEGTRLLRLKEGTLYAGEVRPVREGQNIAQHELVRLKPLSGAAPLCEVETVHTPTAPPASKPAPAERTRGGPPRVSNNTYRKNWNAVFGAAAKKPRPTWSVN
jgi:hypothetical protein